MNWVRRAVATDSADATETREDLQLPRLSRAAVHDVTDERICKALVAAFNAEFPPAQQRPRSLYVVAAGDYYVVEDPTDGIRGLHYIMSFTRKYKRLALLVG